MEDKFVTIAWLPYSKAEVLRSMLEAKGISCTLENVNVIQGAIATGVKVSINVKNAQKALPMLDKILGKVEKTALKTENSILIPIDFSAYSLKAATIAVEISQKFRSTLVFYHIITKPDMYTIPYSDVMPFDVGLYDHLLEREELAREELEKFMYSLSEQVGNTIWESLKIEQIIKMGDAEDDIMNYIEMHPPRLVVMGIKSSSDKTEQIMGSTTAGVIYKAPIPVMVIPEDVELRNISSVKKLVYATNFDEKDYQSITKLLGLLEPFNTEVTCLHIGQKNQYEWDEAKLKIMKKNLKKNFPNASFKCKMIEGDDVLEELENYIHTKKIDILALTTHKRNLITRFFNPSIARKMVFHLKTPLLVFHA